MAAQTPGIFNIINNQTGLFLDVAGPQPTNIVYTHVPNLPNGTSNQQWNVSYFNPTNGSGSGYIITAVGPKSHVVASDDVGPPGFVGNPTIQKIWYIHRANNCSDLFIFSNQDCAEGLVWEGHDGGVAPLTLEHPNATHGQQFWKMVRLD